MGVNAANILLDAATANARGEKHPAMEFLSRVNGLCTAAAAALTHRTLTSARKSGGSASFESGDMQINVRSGKSGDIMLEAVKDDQSMTIRCMPWLGRRVGALHGVTGLASDEVEEFIEEITVALPQIKLKR
jgi:hypothetical protein